MNDIGQCSNQVFKLVCLEDNYLCLWNVTGMFCLAMLIWKAFYEIRKTNTRKTDAYTCVQAFSVKT